VHLYRMNTNHFGTRLAPVDRGRLASAVQNKAPRPDTGLVNGGLGGWGDGLARRQAINAGPTSMFRHVGTDLDLRVIGA
jgi:hypothetical protein